jgi:hypothetical protein
MSNPCELFKVCRFITGFERNQEVVREGWIETFCENRDESEKCRRKRILKATGSPPIFNMTPTGKLLS